MTTTADNTPPATFAVDLRSVSISIGGAPILSDLSLQSDAHRIGVIGRNGSGKTTLARVIAGLLEPDSGQSRILNVDVFKDRHAAIRTVGILFQNPEHQIIFPTVAEEIGFGLRQLGHDKPATAAGVSAILARFGKAHWADAPVHVLSQGQKHLVCMMAVLAMQPKLLILDEPFAGLDIPTRMQLTRQLDNSSTGILHITHDIRDLADYDQVFWLDAGKIRASGKSDQILEQFTAEMIRLGAGDDLTDLAG